MPEQNLESVLKPSGWETSRFREGKTTLESERKLSELAEAIEQPDLPNSSYSRNMAIAAGLTGIAAVVEGCAGATQIVYPAGAPWIISDYGAFYNAAGQTRRVQHTGIDIGGDLGHPIIAAADGVVIFSGWDSGRGGNTITIEHWQESDGIYIRTVYMHNEENLVIEGQKVARGQMIAKMGKTGSGATSGLVHVHYMVFLGQTPKKWDGTWRYTNPHEYWIDGKITCFDHGIKYPEKPIRFTYPVECKK